MARVFVPNLACEADWALAWQRGRYGAEAGLGGKLGQSDRGLPSLALPPGLVRAREWERSLAGIWTGLLEDDDRVVIPSELRSFSGARGASSWQEPRSTAAGHTRRDGERAVGDSGSGSGQGKPAELVPWGSTETVRRMCAQAGFDWGGEDPQIAMRLNQRSERHRLEVELGMELPGSRVIESQPELERVLGRGLAGTGRWILKANYGMSGRESIRGQGASLSLAAARFCATRLRQSGPLVWEPLLEPVDEVGVLWGFSPLGQPELLGVARQWIAGGSWRGCLFLERSAATEHWLEAIAETKRVAERVSMAGYRGPLGIDAMWYRTPDGRVKLRALQDLNARWTMGRVGLGWRQRFSRYEASAWIWSAGVSEADTAGATAEFSKWLGPKWRVAETRRTSDWTEGNASTGRAGQSIGLGLESVSGTGGTRGWGDRDG